MPAPQAAAAVAAARWFSARSGKVLVHARHMAKTRSKKWGMPVSTTHLSCGALFGVGIANGRAQWTVIRTILLAWLLTLTTAAFLSGSVYLLIRQL